MTEWDKIETRLPSALDWLFGEFIMLWNGYVEDDGERANEWDQLVADAKARYEKGRAQHAESGSTWAGWTDEQFVSNIREELIDAVIYAAMREARKVENR